MKNTLPGDLKIGELVEIEGWEPGLCGIISFLPEDRELDDEGRYWIEIGDENQTRGPFPHTDCKRLDVKKFKQDQPERFQKLLLGFTELRLTQMMYVAYCLASGKPKTPAMLNEQEFIIETYQAFQLLGIPHDLPTKKLEDLFQKS